MKESYFDFESCYEEYDEDECEDCDDKVEAIYQEWLCNPDYEGEVDLKNRYKGPFKTNNPPFQRNIIQAVNVDDVNVIISTYQKEK